MGPIWSSRRLARRLLAGAFVVAAIPAMAEDTETFYASHKLTVGVPNSAGGLYDIYTRALVRHYARHLPGNPTIIVQNVPAAGGMALANQLYNTAPRDGTYIGMVRGTTVQEQVYGNPQVQFDGRRFIWIGNMNSDYDSCVVWTDSGIRDLDDFYKAEVVVGASGVGAQSFSFPTAYRELLGMKLKVISGYPGTPERIVAMERGELTGACGVSTSSYRSQFDRLTAEGKIVLVAQAGLHDDPKLPPGIPNILDQAKTPEMREALQFLFLPLALGRPFAAPPDTPMDRVEILRRGMLATLKDPDFLEDAGKLKIDIEAIGADETERMAKELFATPPGVVARLEAALSQSQ